MNTEHHPHVNNKRIKTTGVRTRAVAASIEQVIRHWKVYTDVNRVLLSPFESERSDLEEEEANP